MKVNLENKVKISIEPIWCATANVKNETSFGEEHILRKGTKHFRGGAKIYIADAYWGMCNSVTVIGHHRSNSRFVKVDMHVKHLENFRLQLVYSPKVIELINKNSVESFIEYNKEYSEYLIAIIPEWIEMYHKNEN
ncbi:MAG: hypothetical protein K1X72_00770 [Pyrinomonadaceae bacterium]|nr:hypothetical protein [Pyrinomonadaceae bacterium]